MSVCFDLRARCGGGGKPFQSNNEPLSSALPNLQLLKPLQPFVPSPCRSTVGALLTQSALLSIGLCFFTLFYCFSWSMLLIFYSSLHCIHMQTCFLSTDMCKFSLDFPLVTGEARMFLSCPNAQVVNPALECTASSPQHWVISQLPGTEKSGLLHSPQWPQTEKHH